MDYFKNFLNFIYIADLDHKILLAKQLENDFNKSYRFFADGFLSHSLSALNIPSVILEDMRNDYEFNNWFLNNYLSVLFSYGWMIGFLDKYISRYNDLETISLKFHEEAKEALLLGADEILNYFRDEKIATIYTTCGNNMFFEGKDAGGLYNGDILITRL